MRLWWRSPISSPGREGHSLMIAVFGKFPPSRIFFFFTSGTAAIEPCPRSPPVASAGLWPSRPSSAPLLGKTPGRAASARRARPRHLHCATRKRRRGRSFVAEDRKGVRILLGVLLVAYHLRRHPPVRSVCGHGPVALLREKSDERLSPSRGRSSFLWRMPSAQVGEATHTCRDAATVEVGSDHSFDREPS